MRLLARYRRLFGIAAFLLLLAAGLNIGVPASSAVVSAAPPDFVRVCPGPANPGTARCHSIARPLASSSPTGLSPAKIKTAYNFPTGSTAGGGKTIAIVDAFDDPTAE